MLRAAFATGDGININRHFGVADRFDIYEIDRDNKSFVKVDTRRIDSLGVSLQHDDSLLERLADEIDDCNIVFSARSGEHARKILYDRKIQSVDIEREVEFVINKLFTARVDIVDPRYKEEKERKQNNGDNKNHSFENLQKRHPCLGGHSNVTAGRLHLPVSPVCNIGCRFCSRGFDKSVISPRADPSV